MTALRPIRLGLNQVRYLGSQTLSTMFGGSYLLFDFTRRCWYPISIMADRSEFESIAMVYLDTVYKAAVTLCSDHEDAKDLVQMTFLKAFERFESFEKDTNCKAWLLSILRNKWIDQARHKNVVGEVLPIEESVVAGQRQEVTVWSNYEDLLANFSDEQVIKTLKELPDEQRLTLFLIDVERLDQQEVAKIMDVAVGTVKSRTSRARVVFKEKLSSYAKEMGFIKGKR